MPSITQIIGAGMAISSAVRSGPSWETAQRLLGGAGVRSTTGSATGGILVDDVTRTAGDVLPNVADNRAPDTSQPRVPATDPTAVVDVPTASGPMILKFPSENIKYFMSFAFSEYSRPTQFQNISLDGLTDYITLPLPNNLIDGNAIQYDMAEGKFLGDALAQVIGAGRESVAQNGLQGALGALTDPSTWASMASGGGAIMSGAGVNMLVSTAGTAAGMIGAPGAVPAALQALGVAENPFPVVGLKGPQFKQHQFAWKLIAHNPAETETIRAITETFKKAAYPELMTQESGGFYKYPMLVYPKINPEEARNMMYTFKPCVISELQMNYSTDTGPAFFQTSAPLEVTLSMTLIEIELWRNGNGTGGLAGTIPNGDFPATNSNSPPLRTIAQNLGTV